MKDDSLFDWAGFNEDGFEDNCECEYTIAKYGKACHVCKLAQMADFNYVAGMMEAFGPNNKKRGEE